MQAMDFWRLSPELSVNQAAHLMIGMLPGEVEAQAAVGAELTPSSRRRYETDLAAARSAIVSAIRIGDLPATCTRIPFEDEDADEVVAVVPGTAIDVELTSVRTVDLKKWLAANNMRCEFFFPDAIEAVVPDYLNPEHPSYASLLAAGIAVREALPEAPPGKSWKTGAEEWLTLHAAEYDALMADGKPSKSAIEAVAKVANHQRKGGAPKTPKR